MNLVAFDPGTSLIGWARVTVVGPRARFREGGIVPCSFERVEAIMRDADAVAVERPKGHVFKPERGAQLISTSWVGGGIAWLAQSRRTRCLEFSAQEVRKALCGRASAGDQAVKQAVELNVDGAAGARTNVHVRDALALAVVAVWQLHGCIGGRSS